MPETLLSIIETLEALAGYQGPWKTLREAGPRILRQAAELRERAERLDDVLVVALVGGSGVGKSTLLNAIAGDNIAETSAMRPCTSVPVVYHPPGVSLDFGDWKNVPRSALEHLALIDTPDTDTVVHRHRELATDVLSKCDLILLCATSEKYADEDTWSILRPLREQRTMACVETKASEQDSVREDWLRRLEAQEFHIEAYFRVNARNALDRKLNRGAPGPAEYDFSKLEEFLRHELSRERIARIKRSNAEALADNVMRTLAEQGQAVEASVEALAGAIHEAEKTLSNETIHALEQRLFATPHLWNYALGREMGLRSKGITGVLFRLVEAVRSLPARLPAMLPGAGLSAGQHAAALLTGAELLGEGLDSALEGVFRQHHTQARKLALAFEKAGIDAPSPEDSDREIRLALTGRLGELIQGPARQSIVRAAARLGSWWVALLFDALPLAFMVYCGYKILVDYFVGVFLGLDFFVHSATVLGMIFAVELLLLSGLARLGAWRARRKNQRDLRAALHSPGLFFRAEAQAIESLQQSLAKIKTLPAGRKRS